MFVAGLGISSVPWILASEWPEMNVKGLVNTATTFCYFSSVFLSAQLTTVVNKYFGITVSFAIFAVINSLVFILTWTAIPETHGLSYHKHKQQQLLRTQTSNTTADQASLER